MDDVQAVQSHDPSTTVVADRPAVKRRRRSSPRKVETGSRGVARTAATSAIEGSPTPAVRQANSDGRQPANRREPLLQPHNHASDIDIAPPRRGPAGRKRTVPSQGPISAVSADPGRVTPPPGSVEPRKRLTSEAQAGLLSNGMFAVLTASALGLDQYVDAVGYKLHWEQFLEEAGNPTDPVERILLQQLYLCHFRAAVLHSRAENNRGSEVTRMFNDSAARLSAECRKIALALKEYRSPPSARGRHSCPAAVSVETGTGEQRDLP